MSQHKDSIEENNDPASSTINKSSPLLENKKIARPNMAHTNLANLDSFLEKEKKTNSVETWGKLDKTTKNKKMAVFVESYAEEFKLNSEEKDSLDKFLKDCLNKKKIARVKDINYDKITGEIKEITGLVFNRESCHFTLKNMDKHHQSTLKSLTPRKKVDSISKDKKNKKVEEVTSIDL